MRYEGILLLSFLFLLPSASWNDDKMTFLFDHLYSCRKVGGSLAINPDVTVTPYGIACIVPDRDGDDRNDVPHWTNKEGPVYPPEERHT